MAGSTDKIMLIAAFVSSFFIFIGIITTTLFLTSEDKAKLIEVKDISKGKLLPEGLIGRYNASSLTTSSWDDISGKSNHIKSENIKGIDKIKKGFGFKGEYVYGGIDTSIELPQQFKGSNWTFFAVARYNGTNKKRIFTTKKPVADTDINWLAGFYAGRTGVAHYGGGCGEDCKTNGYLNKKYDATTAPDGVSYDHDDSPNSLHGQNSWVLLMSTKQTFRTNGKNRHDSGAATYAVAPEKFGINLWDTQLSDWAVYEMLVFDKWLADDRIVEVETYLREKYILADLSTGIDYKKGKPTLTPKTLDFFGTNEECRLHAREQGSKMWGRNTDKHDTNDDRNKCFFYDDHVPVDDTDKFEGDDENVTDVTGCVEKTKDVSTYCTTKKEGRYGSGVDTSGVCKAIPGSGGSYMTDDKVQSTHCDTYVNKPQCEDGTINIDTVTTKNKSELCRWDDGSYKYEFIMNIKNEDLGIHVGWIKLDGVLATKEQTTIHKTPNRHNNPDDMFTVDGNAAWNANGHDVGEKIFTIVTDKKVNKIDISYGRPKYAPGWIIKENGVAIITETSNRGTAEDPSPQTYTYDIPPSSS